MKQMWKGRVLLALNAFFVVSCGVNDHFLSSSFIEQHPSTSSGTLSEEIEGPIVFKPLDLDDIRMDKLRGSDLAYYKKNFYAVRGVVSLIQEAKIDGEEGYFYLQNGDNGIAVQYSSQTKGVGKLAVGKTLTVHGYLVEHPEYAKEVLLRTTYQEKEEQGEILEGEEEIPFLPFSGVSTDEFTLYFGSYVALKDLKVIEKTTFDGRPSLTLRDDFEVVTFGLDPSESCFEVLEIKETLEKAKIGDRVEFQGVWLARDSSKGKFVTLIPEDTFRFYAR